MSRGITEIAGIKVGHYTDAAAMTGCTAVLFEGGAVGGVDVRGSAPERGKRIFCAGITLWNAFRR